LGLALAGWVELGSDTSADHIGEAAELEPVRKRADQCRRAVDLDQSLVDRPGQRDPAHPDVVERPDVRGHEQVGVESGSIATYRGIPALKDEPEGLSAFAVEIELYDDPLPGEQIEVDPPVHPPQQQCWVEFLGPRFGQRPTRSPPTQIPDGPLQLFPRRRQMIFAPAITRGAPFQQAESRESFEAPLEQGPRDPGKASGQLIEVTAAVQELADDQDCPTVTQDLRSPRDWTILVVWSHASIIAGSRECCPVAFLYCMAGEPIR